VRDFGRGIPLGKVVDCVSKINTGAKYNDEVFQFSVGLNGVGTKAVNALSKDFYVRTHREGEFAEASFKQGKLKGEKSGKISGEPDGTLIRFEPDPTVFKTIDFRAELIEKRLRHYSYLNSGLKLLFNGKEFVSRRGLMDLVLEDLQTDNSEAIYPPLHYAGKTLGLPPYVPPPPPVSDCPGSCCAPRPDAARSRGRSPHRGEVAIDVAIVACSVPASPASQSPRRSSTKQECRSC